MLFNSYSFIFFYLPLVLLGFFQLARISHTFAAGWLAAASLFFYGWWNPRFILLMFFVTVVNYGCGHFMARANATRRERRLWLAVAVVSSLGTLGFFKYFMFVQSNVHAILAWSGAGPSSG